jgi:limonene-1,2-epoxide hydrolase
VSDAATPLEIARAWMDAAARCDIDAIADGMAEGCLRYGEPEWAVIAKAPYIAAYRQFLRSFSAYRLEIVNTVGSGRTVVFEMIESACFTGPYPLPDGRTLQPNGQSYTDRVCTWIEVDDEGKVAEIRAYVPSTRGRVMAEAVAASS